MPRTPTRALATKGTETNSNTPNATGSMSVSAGQVARLWTPTHAEAHDAITSAATAVQP